MKTLILAIVFLGLASSAQASDLQRFIGQSYDTLRAELIAQGYAPAPVTPLSDCFEDQTTRQCLLYPEIQACAGTGAAPCKMRWVRGDAVVDVDTIGDDYSVTDIARF